MRLVYPLFLFCSCAVVQDNSFIERAELLMGDHYNVYTLPFEKGKSVFVVQGYESLFSHKGDYAIDFKVKPGTRIVAARDGVVYYVQQSYAHGGITRQYVGKGNGITIKHKDGTYAHYWHIQHEGALVSVGDSVQQGQVIGL